MVFLQGPKSLLSLAPSLCTCIEKKLCMLIYYTTIYRPTNDYTRTWKPTMPILPNRIFCHYYTTCPSSGDIQFGYFLFDKIILFSYICFQPYNYFLALFCTTALLSRTNIHWNISNAPFNINFNIITKLYTKYNFNVWRERFAELKKKSWYAI